MGSTFKITLSPRQLFETESHVWSGAVKLRLHLLGLGSKELPPYHHPHTPNITHSYKAPRCNPRGSSAGRKPEFLFRQSPLQDPRPVSCVLCTLTESPLRARHCRRLCWSTCTPFPLMKKNVKYQYPTTVSKIACLGRPQEESF